LAEPGTSALPFPALPAGADLELLFDTLSPALRQALMRQPDHQDLLEVVLDLGREPEARYPGREALLSSDPVTAEDLRYVEERVGTFGGDNRAGIERTLHRISALRNRDGKIVGLTCRAGRAVTGTAEIIADVVVSGRNVLLLGAPGIGKTTMLRECARVLSTDQRKRVVVVDTSNEIAGDGDIPHPGIGRARRLQVPAPSLQHAVMIEAVENHMPEVIIIDEIGTELEAQAARTIAERGVQLIGTAHGTRLENLLLNPTLCDLLGGIQTVTLGDEEARRRGSQKSVLERKAPPTFDVLVEIEERERVAVHTDVAAVVDAALRGQVLPAELRQRHEDGSVTRRLQRVRAGEASAARRLLVAEGWEALPDERGRRARGLGEWTGASGLDDNYGQAEPESRWPAPEVGTSPLPPEAAALAAQEGGEGPLGGPVPATVGALSIHPYGISSRRLQDALADLGLPGRVTADAEEADVILTLKNYLKKKPQAVRAAEALGVPVHVLKSNTQMQIRSALAGVFGLEFDREEMAVSEAMEAIVKVQAERRPVELSPQRAYIRRQQHELAERYALLSKSTGREPNRRVKIYTTGR
jgi:stage III sporulation protein SpoIIIAA